MVLVNVTLLDVVVVVVSQPLHVLAHCSEKESHRSPVDNFWHCANENVFVLFTHLSAVDVVLVDDVEVLVLVEEDVDVLVDVLVDVVVEVDVDVDVVVVNVVEVLVLVLVEVV